MAVTSHTFQIPRVESLGEAVDATVVLRISLADTERILRALDAISMNLARAPSASHAVTAYRRLTAGTGEPATTLKPADQGAETVRENYHPAGERGAYSAQTRHEHRPERRRPAMMYDILEGSWALGQLASVIDELMGRARISQELRDAAFTRAATLHDHPGRGGQTPRGALVGFARDIIAELGVELMSAPDHLRTLTHNLQDVAGIPAVELELELLRAPQLLALPPSVTVDMELGFLLAFANARAVSLWRARADDEPEPIAAAGDLDATSRPMGHLARRLLSARPTSPTPDSALAGVLVPGSRVGTALVAYSDDTSSAQCPLLLEAAIPILAAALEREVSRGRPSAARPDADRDARKASAAERRLARVQFDLHDGPQQDLMLLGEDLRLFRSQLESVLAGNHKRTRLLGRIDDLEARLVALEGDLRRISVSAQSPFLHRESLHDVLVELTTAFALRTGTEPDVELQGDFSELTDSQHITLLGLIREALSNIREHAHARRVSIRISAGPDGVEAIVTDDGQGFEPEATLVKAAREGHLGLVGMHERVRMLGGHTEIESRPGGPTLISVKLPRAPEGVPTRQ